MSEKGGITKGKSHKEGGIPMVVKSTGQQVELEGGEGVINKRNMASDSKFEFQGKQMTTCEIASAINSANGNGVKIDCDDVTGKKYAYEDGGVVFIDYNENEIMYEPIDRKYYANDKEFDSLEEAQKFLDSGGVNEDLRGAYERGLFEKGGWLLVNSDTERTIREYATESEARQMMYEYDGDSFVIKKSELEKEKLKETYRPPAPLNPATYIGMERGGGIKDYNSLIGKYVNIYSMGVSLPTEHQIKDVEVSGENFRYRYVTLKFDLGIAPIPFDEATAFMNNDIIYVNNNKEEFGIQLMPNQFNEGGGVDDLPKAFRFKLKRALSTINELLTKAGGTEMTEEDAKMLMEHYQPESSYLATDKALMISGADEELLSYRETKELGEALMTFNYKFKMEAGGDVRDFDWYQMWKKDQVKKGTAHEMEHLDTIREFKKRGVSDKEVAQAIAKDHLEEDENYYIELDKMESSREVSKALTHHDKNKNRRKNAKKFSLGGYTGYESELIYIKMKEDVTTDLFSFSGRFYSETTFKKNALILMNFISNNGFNTKLEIHDTGVYAVIPNVAFEVVGFNSEKFGEGGGVKAQYEGLNLSKNDKQILSVLRTLNENNATHIERESISNFRGENVVNQLTKAMINKIYSLLFKWHDVNNPIHNLYIENVGAGNILSLAPTALLRKIYVQFVESNPYVEIEKKICEIANSSITYQGINNYDLKNVDAILKVYEQTNPLVDTIVQKLYATEKNSIALGVAEFTSMQHIENFKTSINLNMGAFAQNQMMIPKEMKYFVVNESITEKGTHTLIYGITKV